MNRHSDPDEFQFVSPPTLLLEFHKLPYRDYPYFHTPNLIYIQAVFTAWTSQKLLVARCLSAACGTATIILLAAAGSRLLKDLPRAQRQIFCLGTVTLFATSRLFTYTSGNGWNHDSAVLCALTACLLLLHGLRRGRIAPILAAGFLIGMATGIRLSFALAVVPFAVSVCLSPSVLSRVQRVAALSAAGVMAAVANLPSIVLASNAPRQFLFGTIGYARLSTEYYRSVNNRFGMTFVGKIGSSLSKFVTDPCNFLILAGFLLAIGVLLHRSRGFSASGQRCRSEMIFLLTLIFSLWIGAMGPTPMMQQYNYMYLPFMVLFIFYGFKLLNEMRVNLRRPARALFSLTILFGVSGAFRWYWSVVYITRPEHWQPNIQHREAIWIAKQAGPAARVLTIESEIPLEAGLEIYPEFAVGRFVLLVNRFATPEQRRAQRLVGPLELPGLLDLRPPDAVFVRSDAGCDRLFTDYAKAHHFVPIRDPDGSSVLWVKPAHRLE